MQPKLIPSLRQLLLAVLAVATVEAQELRITPDRADGLYEAGQTIRWDVRLQGEADTEVKYVLKKGGLTELTQGVVPLREGRAQVEARLDEPGWLLLEASVRSTNEKPVKALGGALVAPGKIAPNGPPPADFDAFWQGKLDELAAVPMNPRVQPAVSPHTNVEYFKVTLDNIRGSQIRGQLARPRGEAKRPAMLIVQWAGVYGLQTNWVVDPAVAGWLVLDINAHDLPIDEPAAFYQAQSAGALREYWCLGNDDREKSYFLRMYLSCYRGAEYLAQRPEWDGRTLVVTGGSQGGLQSFVAAALHPRITAVLANVPAGCDLNGPEAGRLPGWPMWYRNVRGKDPAKVRDTARYFDVVNFAPRVKCPVLVGVGLIDTTCPSPGIFAACNRLAGPREIVMLPLAEHGEKDGSHRPYYARFEAWKSALVRGEAAPLK